MTNRFYVALATAVVVATSAHHEARADSKLADAVAAQNIKKVQKLLAEGAGVNAANKEGHSALFFAAGSNNLPLVEQLVSKGAVIDQVGDDGITPLNAALRNPMTSLPLVQFLMAKGADVNAADKSGSTPLMQAVLRAPGILDVEAQTTMIKTLLAAGANPGLVDSAGATALHHAAYIGEPRKVLELLLAASKTPDALTTSGANILMMAAQNRQRANFDYLLGRGFRPVLIRAVALGGEEGGQKPELAQDMSPRANALSQDWWGQYASRKGDPAAAIAAYATAAREYDRAAVEAERLVAAYEKKLVQDKIDRNNRRAAAGFATVLTTAVTLGAGYSVVYMANQGTAVELSERAIAAYRTEAQDVKNRAAELRTKIAAN